MADSIDIQRGDPAVSAPGSARLAYVAGQLCISQDGGAFIPIDRTGQGQIPLVVPPNANTPTSAINVGMPAIWYDAQDIDGLGNTSLTDGQQISTWKNKGWMSRGFQDTPTDLVQGTASLRPLFKKIADAPWLLNHSSVVFDGVDDFLRTAVFANLAGPYAWGVLARQNAAGSATYFCGDATHVGLEVSGALIGLNGAALNTGFVPCFDTTRWETMTGLFNGTASTINFMGRVSSGDAGSNVSLTQMTLGMRSDGVLPLAGQIMEFVLYQGANLPTPAQIQRYLEVKHRIPLSIGHFGDSTTSGAAGGQTSEFNWLGYRGRLANSLPAWSIRPAGTLSYGCTPRPQNDGNVGDPLANIAARIATSTTAWQQNVGILLGGVNDVRAPRTIAQMLTDTQTCITNAFATGSMQALIVCSAPKSAEGLLVPTAATILQDETLRQYNIRLPALCDTNTALGKKCIFLDMWTPTNPAVHIENNNPPNIHFNDAGYAMWAEKILPLLAPYLPFFQ